MLIPTAMATSLAAEEATRRRGAAAHRINLPNPFAGLARARLARRRPAALCVAC
jgi:hypothetical protein